ncbi:putative xylosidase/glycosyl hydrolase [Xylariomycetidae sp. FL0641]|nr:putative xylosidase/glycosyl hydrolase [Xylariomycetidae sp. FL0641]
MPNLPGDGTGWRDDSSCALGQCDAAPNPSATTEASRTVTARAASGSFTNPVIYEDLADLDIFRVGDAFYYSASTMAYSPGAPILRSYDLANWEYIGHSVPTLEWDSKYDLTNGQRAYVQGIWASTMRYRESTDTWYWIGCIQSGNTYVYTAPAVEGPWSLSGTISTCFYDAGLLIDDDDTMYVAYGNTQLSVAQLSSDGLSMVSTKVVFSSGSIGTVEGSRFYKYNGQYYILVTHPATAEYVLKSSSPTGSYTSKVLVNSAKAVTGGGYPHQGGIVDTPNGDWYYMAFDDAYPAGRPPVLAPITWGSDGFPTLDIDNNVWGTSYPMTLEEHPMPSLLGTDNFTGSALGHAWEWNHNPDTSAFTVGDGLTLNTATVTNDLFQARNTLTHRIHGPISTATIAIDTSNMAAGDRAGLALFRDQTAWIGVKNDGGSFSVGMTNGLTLSTSGWTTTSTGTTVDSASISSGTVYLRCTADIRPTSSHTATFSYSTDGSKFETLGPDFTMTTDWRYFIGYRWGIFNYATSALGGSVHVSSFDQEVSY